MTVAPAGNARPCRATVSAAPAAAGGTQEGRFYDYASTIPHLDGGRSSGGTGGQHDTIRRNLNSTAYGDDGGIDGKGGDSSPYYGQNMRVITAQQQLQQQRRGQPDDFLDSLLQVSTAESLNHPSCSLPSHHHHHHQQQQYYRHNGPFSKPAPPPLWESFFNRPRVGTNRVTGICSDTDEDFDDISACRVGGDKRAWRRPEASDPRRNPSREAVDGCVGGFGGAALFPGDGSHIYSGNFGRRDTYGAGFAVGGGGDGDRRDRIEQSSSSNVVREKGGNRSKTDPTAGGGGGGGDGSGGDSAAEEIESEEAVAGGKSNASMNDDCTSSSTLAHHESPPRPPLGGGDLRSSIDGGGSNPLTLLLSAKDFYPTISTTRSNTSLTVAADSRNTGVMVDTNGHRQASPTLTRERGPVLGSIRESFLGSVREAIPEQNHPHRSHVGGNDIGGRTDTPTYTNISTRTLCVGAWGSNNIHADNFGNAGRGSLGTKMSQPEGSTAACSSGKGGKIALEEEVPADPSTPATSAARELDGKGGGRRRERRGRHDLLVSGNTPAEVEESKIRNRKSLDELLREMMAPLPTATAATVESCGSPLRREALCDFRTNVSGSGNRGDDPGSGVVAATSNSTARVCL